MKRSLQALFTFAVFMAPSACKVSVNSNSAEAADASRPNEAGAKGAEAADAPVPADAPAPADAPEAQPETPAPGAPTALTAKPRVGETAEGAAPGGTELAASPANECTDGTRKAGETWKAECNTCQCKNGQPMCTRMKCDADSAK